MHHSLRETFWRNTVSRLCIYQENYVKKLKWIYSLGKFAAFSLNDEFMRVRTENQRRVFINQRESRLGD